MEEQLTKFKAYCHRIKSLQATGFLLAWDQDAMMPEGGVADRGDQIAVIDTLIHEMIVSDEMGKMLETLTPYASQLPYDSLDASLIRYMARQFARETCLPSELVSEISGHQSTSIDAWKKARAANDFKIFQPHLEKMFDLIQKKGAYLAPKGNPYDGLLEYYEPGIDSAWVQAIFEPLRPRLTELVKAITAHKDRVDGRLIRREVTAAQQLAFAAEVAASIGYDFKRGRLDTVAHPFAWGTGKGDSRITTKVVADNPMWCIEGASHESGHAMHLQNMTDEVARTPMAYFNAGAILESQSRLFENMVGRSKPFWTAMLPRLKKAFAPTFDDLKLDDFYRALNESKPSPVRIEADEVTYGLHIMLRFELENEVLNGRVKVSDLPEEWNDRTEAYLGIEPPSDADGVLQDVHWSWGLVGYFPGYLLGSMFAAQLWAALKRDIPDIDDQMAAGSALAVLPWTADKVMQYGGMFTFAELTDRAVGGFSAEPYIDYLTAKFTEIYGLT